MSVLEPIESGALTGIGYDRELSVLTLAFRSGGIYEYYAVPESLYVALLEAQPHPWTEHQAEVERHPFRKVEE